MEVSQTLLARKIAEQFELTADEEPLKRVTQVISRQAQRMLFQAYGHQAMPFFQLYERMFRHTMGELIPEEEKIRADFLTSSRRIFRGIPEEADKDRFDEMQQELMIQIIRFDQGSRGRIMMRRIAILYGPLVKEVAQFGGVYLRGRRANPTFFLRFRKMRAPEEKLEKLKEKDPEFYESLVENQQVVRNIEKKIDDTIEEAGLRPERKRLMGQLVQTGVDPVTDEAVVYLKNGEVVPIETFLQKKKEEGKAIRRINRLRNPREKDFKDLKNLESEDIERLVGQKGKDRIFIPNLEDVRSLSDEELETQTLGETRFIAITDDKLKYRGVTRILPVKDTIEGNTVVVDGRFKGMHADDLINKAGRLVEGSAYDYNPARNEMIPLQTTSASGKVELHASREPYVTVNEKGQLMIMVPRDHGHKEQRNLLYRLQLESDSIKYEKKTHRSTYTFESKDFGMIKEAIGGMALSQAAVKIVAEHFEKLSRQEAARSEEVTKFYSAEKIGGFKPGFDFMRTQKESMGWCEARGWSGLLSPDTGLGKTSIAMGCIQKMYRDGVAGESGRFLYVCPAALKGNLPKEIRKFSTDAKDLIKRIDIMSYSKFLIESKKNRKFADGYIAVFFDEAQAVKNANKTHKAIAAVNNSRKILLTASPMERDPEELFMLSALANNVRMYDDKGKQLPEFTEKKRKWKRRYAETVGNRVMGIKDDPAIKKEFHQWVKSNLYYKKKTEATEVTIGGLRRDTVKVAMDPEIEAAYRAEVDSVKGIMQDMVRKYRDDVKEGLDPRIDAFKGGRLQKVFRRLQRLSDLPHTVIPGARSPKHDQATNIIKEKVGGGSRTLLFTDSPEMALETVRRMSLEFPGRSHAVALSNSIQIWKDGEVVREFREKAYRDPETGKRNRASDWKVFILKHEVSNKSGVLSCTLTKTYSKGQNLQRFTTVIHMDRDTWNSEEMKQRTARSWRTGQKNQVEEYTLDTVYEESNGDLDSTLDEIRNYMQDMEEELFDEVVRDSQRQALGVEYTDIAQVDASLVALNRRYMEQALSPYAEQVE